MPNSILWIGLVVLWVFVLFPILADRHPRIRRTTDAALNTRVLHRGGSKRRMKKGPAAGHDSDPDYRPTRVHRRRIHSDDAEDRMSTPADENVTENDENTGAASAGGKTGRGGERRGAEVAESDSTREPDAEESAGADSEQTVVASEDVVAEGAESDGSDVVADSDDDADVSGTVRADSDDTADARGAADERDTADSEDAPREPATARIPPARSAAPARVPDLEYDADDPEFDTDFVPTRRGRGGFDPEADAIARAARYTFRQRAVLGLLLAAILCGALALVINPLIWWASGLSALGLITYLAYLRKQVRMEEEIRRRRSARLARNRDAEHAQDDDTELRRAAQRAMDRDTARALRRRSVLLDADDEDPAFDHLDTFDPATARALRDRTGTAGMRRAAGE
ncbi:hypothetical protein IU487_30105 [Nocardia puris]|uniref:divisome protein SepX/GlpR n=1 Tax=Nocardia puris TaxID=208602 RepID=UPI001894E702|nr:gephyrin-like molybdotransferase receptor GlpR [Nocardia puris]MBF6215254.1 hypothetical protein [Nocardia puris]